MERWAGRVALITGANSGIGATLAQKLLKHGMIVIGVDRDITNIEIASRKGVAKGKLVPMKCNVTKDDEVYAVFDKIEKEFNCVDVCVNNAGLTHNKTLLEGEPSEWREMLEVNVVALSLFTKLSVASMRKKNVDDGHIINICSVAGHHVYPVGEFHFYASTKWAVKALTEALRQELEEAKSKIRVSQISPGVIKTNFYSKFSSEMMDLVHSILPPLNPDDIASAIEHIISLPPHVEVRDIIVTGKGS